MSKEQYKEMVMKHLNTDTYEQVVDKNIDKKVMDNIEDSQMTTRTFSSQKKQNTSRISNTLQAIFTSYQRFIKVRKLQDSWKLALWII